MTDYPFPEPFGADYARPPGEECPDCECCTKALCETARAAEHWISRSCALHADDPDRVRGCPCGTPTPPPRPAPPAPTGRLCAACGLPTGADDADVCSEACNDYLNNAGAEAAEPEGKDYSDLEGN